MMLWFHWLLAASILGFVLWNRRTQWRREVVWVGIVFVAAGCLAAAISWPGLLSVQKTLTALALPCGLIWLSLLGATLLAWQHRRKWSGCLLLLVFFTLAGNSTVASVLMSWMQAPFVAIDPLQAGDFDAIVVLGGGAGKRPRGHLQVNDSGDRVVLAARLYHAGRAPILVTAEDQSARDRSQTADSAGPTRGIWRQLRIPDAAIVSISGRNTREEIIVLRDLIESRQWRRVGLITSAWHLHRAMRLARAHHVEVHPLPADFRGGEVASHNLSLIPDAGALRNVQFGVKELFAMAVGR